MADYAFYLSPSCDPVRLTERWHPVSNYNLFPKSFNLSITSMSNFGSLNTTVFFSANILQVPVIRFALSLLTVFHHIMLERVRNAHRFSCKAGVSSPYHITVPTTRWGSLLVLPLSSSILGVRCRSLEVCSINFFFRCIKYTFVTARLYLAATTLVLQLNKRKAILQW